MASNHEALDAFKKEASSLIGVDLGAYQDRQMGRRILALMGRAGQSDPGAYLDVLRSDERRLREFSLGITIHVSQWFRNPDQFETLADAVLPELLERFGRLRIWSAGCSLGAELYSTMILVDRLGALDRCEFLGTDLDDEVLAKARQGVFAPGDQKGLPAEVVRRDFEALADGQMRLAPALASRARFARHDLLADPYGRGFHLVLCRNVAIYFTAAIKARVFSGLASALEPGGFLFVGNSERIVDADSCQLHPVRPFFYRKAG